MVEDDPSLIAREVTSLPPRANVGISNTITLSITGGYSRTILPT
jgi:hypothetical protein